MKTQMTAGSFDISNATQKLLDDSSKRNYENEISELKNQLEKNQFTIQ